MTQPPIEHPAHPQAARAATRTLDVLELLARKPTGMTMREIAVELSVPTSSLHPLLRALEARRYLVRGRDRHRYCLGPRLLEVGRAYLDPHEPYAAARRAMHQVTDRCGETTHLAILSGHEVVYVDGTTSGYALSAQSHAGQRFPAHVTAAGKALLAALPPDRLAALYTDAGGSRSLLAPLPSFEALEQELEEIRWTGYAQDIDGIEPGLHGLAALLPEEPGRPSVALSISVPALRFRGNGFQNLLGLLRQVSALPALDRSSGRPRPLIGWSLSLTGHNPVYTQMRRAATEVMERVGGTILWTSAPNEHKQAGDVRRLLEEPLDALIIHPTNAVATAPLFVAARERETLLVCFHRPARTRAFDFFVGSDTYERGCLQAHAAARLLGGKGGIFVVEGGSYDDNARSISQGTRDTLASYSGVRLLGSQPAEEWLPETAQSMVREALSTFGPERLNAVIAANDDMAFAIADVLASQGLTKQVFLIGGDGDVRTIAMIRAGTLAGTVLQDSWGMGAQTLEYVVRVLRGEASVDTLPQRSLFHAPEGPVVRALDVPYTWVDATNIAVLEDYWAAHAQSLSARAPNRGFMTDALNMGVTAS